MHISSTNAESPNRSIPGAPNIEALINYIPYKKIDPYIPILYHVRNSGPQSRTRIPQGTILGPIPILDLALQGSMLLVAGMGNGIYFW